MGNCFDQIVSLLNNNEDCNFLCVTEHWQSIQELQAYNIDKFRLASSYCRQVGEHGGSAIYIKEGLKWKPRKDLEELAEHYIFECSAIQVYLENFKIVLLSIYRNSMSNVEHFFLKLESCLSILVNENVTVFIAGDFNVNILACDGTSVNFLCLLGSYNIFPSITDFTRITNTSRSCIDNIFTNCTNYRTSILNTHLSDHTAQKLTFKCSAQKKTQVIIKKRNFSTENIKYFKQCLREQDWATLFEADIANVEAQWDCFVCIFFPIFEQFFPLKSLRMQTKKKSRYTSPEIILCKQELDNLLPLSHVDHECLEEYKVLKRKYNTLLQNERKSQYKNRILNSPNKSKGVWQIVNEIRGSVANGDHHLPDGDPQVLSNNFNVFFSNVATNLISQLPLVDFDSKISFNLSSMFLKPVSATEIFNIINSLRNSKSSGIDEISSNLLRNCAKELCAPLCYIINNSFREGIFPSKLKMSLVKPLFKKGDPEILDNYRPISLPSTFSKIFEKAMCTRLMDFLSAMNIINKGQHGFLIGKSIETAVFDFIERILDIFENKELGFGACLDLSKAFDCLDYAFLLDKLNKYGIRGPAQEWLRSYLSNRGQKISIVRKGKHYISDTNPINMGVPQGSVIGPILFVIYMNDLPLEFRDPGITIINYADDTNILVKSKNLQDLLNNANNCLELANNWFLKNKLILNTSKSNFLIFRSKQLLVDLPDQVDLLSQNVTLSKETKFLGIYINEHLSWIKEIDYTCSRLSGVCYTLKVLKSYLDLDTLKVVYYANFYSVMKYGVAFWGGSSHSSRVFIIQKRALRTILGLTSVESCRSHFRSTGILTFYGVFIHECVVFLFKNRDKFLNYEINHTYNTRSDAYNIPVHRMALSEKNVLYSCVKFFNRLPKRIRSVKTLREFKNAVFQLLLDREPYTVDEFLS